MNPRCVTDEELSFISELPPESEALRHVASCARCRARVSAFRSFMDPPQEIEGAHPDDADARLRSSMDREIRLITGRDGAANGQAQASTPATGRSLMRLLWRPALRPVWAAAVLLLVYVGVRELRPSGADEPIILRERVQPAAATLEPTRVAAIGGGGLRLTWNALPDADRYEILLYGEELEPQTRIDAGSAPTVDLPPGELDAVQRGDVLFWSVRAYRGGDVIQASEMSRIEPTRR
jgi:hypothetical protein